MQTNSNKNSSQIDSKQLVNSTVSSEYLCQFVFYYYDLKMFVGLLTPLLGRGGEGRGGALQEAFPFFLSFFWAMEHGGEEKGV